jgi:hypothetical protein
MAARRKAKEVTAGDLRRAEAQLRQERDGEREAMLAWLRAGADKSEYDSDAFPLSDDMARRPITSAYVEKKDRETVLKIRTLLKDRCVRCHATEDAANAKAAKFPLEKHEQLQKYLTVEGGERMVLRVRSLIQERCVWCHSDGGDAPNFPLESYGNLRKYVSTDAGGAMSLNKLAQTTHVHLLGFAVLYGMTGLILAFSGYRESIRLLLAPLPLAAQVLEISLWWLIRLDEPVRTLCSYGIPLLGGVVGVGLGLQLVLAMLDLVGRKGKVVLAVLFLVALLGVGGLYLKVVGPHLQNEKGPAATSVEHGVESGKTEPISH